MFIENPTGQGQGNYDSARLADANLIPTGNKLL